MTHLTEWYPPHIKPVRVGVYNASKEKVDWNFRKWMGNAWSVCWQADLDVDHIAWCKTQPTQDQSNIYWRGLSVAPTPEEK